MPLPLQASALGAFQELASREALAGRVEVTARTRLDTILDTVRAKEHEVTFDVDGYTEEQIDRIIATATARGLHAACSGRHVLVRDLREALPLEPE